MATTCSAERVEQQNNPGIEPLMERRFAKDEFQDQLFDEVDASHRFPRAISFRRPSVIGHSNRIHLAKAVRRHNIIGHSNPIHLAKPVHRPIQKHVENKGDDPPTMPRPRRPIQNHVEDKGDDPSTMPRPRRPIQIHFENEDDGEGDEHPTISRRRRPVQELPFPCPCPCGPDSYFICPSGCEDYGCPPCPCPCGYNGVDVFCPYGCRPRDTCDSPWE